jgi:membrane-associated HD superfamily phosphohydrolase
MEKVTPQKIDQLINDVIEKRIEEHQLDDCDLTLREIRLMADSFKFTLRSMLHSRIAYPGESAAKEAAQKAPQHESGVPPVSAA